jgi:hypothetical protein
MARDKKLTYLNNGFIVGVPARDLVGAEVDKYDIERLESSGLYRNDSPLTYKDDIEVLGDELEAIEDTFEEV